MDVGLRVREGAAYLRAARKDFHRLWCVRPTCDSVLSRVTRLFHEPIERGANAGAGGCGLERKMLADKLLLSNAQWFAVEPNEDLAEFSRQEKDDERVIILQNTLEEAAGPILRQTNNRPLQLVTYSVGVSKLTEKQQDAFLGSIRDLLENDADSNAIGYIFCNIGDALARVFGREHVMKPIPTYGQIIPPWPYLIQQVYKKRPVNRVFDPVVLDGKPRMPKRRKKKDDTSGWWRAISA